MRRGTTPDPYIHLLHNMPLGGDMPNGHKRNPKQNKNNTINTLSNNIDHHKQNKQLFQLQNQFNHV